MILPNSSKLFTMPQATAIIAIACAAGCLSHEAGVVPVGITTCVAKSKRSRALARRASSKRGFIADYDDSTEDHGFCIVDCEDSADEDKQDEEILPSWPVWSQSDIQTFKNMCDESAALETAIHVLASPTVTAKCKELEDDAQLCTQGPLPEDLLLAALQFAGTAGRSVSRTARQFCDVSLREGLLLPTFPLKLSVKQLYHFGPQGPVTTTWSLDVSAPADPSVLEICTDSGGEDHCTAYRCERSGAQVLRLCRELNALQTGFGPHYSEIGRTQVKVVAMDAEGRKFLDHSYEYRTFCNHADDLLEVLTETDPPVSSPTLLQTELDAGRKIPRAQSRSCSGTRCTSRSRSGSMARDARR